MRHLILACVLLLIVTCTGCPPAAVTTSSSVAPPIKAAPGTKDPLRIRLEAAIDSVLARDLEVRHGFWTVFHGILGLGPEVVLVDHGKRIKALDYIRNGGSMEGLQFVETPQGLDVYTASPTGGQFFAQGHQDQFIAEMAQWGVPLDLTFKVNGKERKFAEFVKYTKARASVTRNQELAWAIHIIGEYDGTDVSWTNQYGEKVSLEDLVRYELNSPMDPEQAIRQGQLPLACGGTHRLFGLSWVLHLHQQKGGQLAGIWKETHDRLEELKKTAREFQNPDGSFSTNWFGGKGNVNDPGLRLATSGHILEWLALALRDDELDELWIEQAVSYLCQLFLELQSQPVEGGGLYHAVHGLCIYHARRYGTEKLGPHTPYLHLAPGCKPVVRPTGKAG